MDEPKKCPNCGKPQLIFGGPAVGVDHCACWMLDGPCPFFGGCNARGILGRENTDLRNQLAAATERYQKAEAEIEHLCGEEGAKNDRAEALVDAALKREMQAEARAERLRAALLGVVAAGGEVVLEDDREGAAITTIGSLGVALAEARAALSESEPKGENPCP